MSGLIMGQNYRYSKNVKIVKQINDLQIPSKIKFTK